VAPTGGATSWVWSWILYRRSLDLKLWPLVCVVVPELEGVKHSHMLRLLRRGVVGPGLEVAVAGGRCAMVALRLCVNCRTVKGTVCQLGCCLAALEQRKATWEADERPARLEWLATEAALQTEATSIMLASTECTAIAAAIHAPDAAIVPAVVATAAATAAAATPVPVLAPATSVAPATTAPANPPVVTDEVMSAGQRVAEKRRWDEARETDATGAGTTVAALAAVTTVSRSGRHCGGLRKKRC
jgi:hypothetical protein